MSDETKVYRYVYALPGKGVDLSVQLPELALEDIEEIEELFRLIIRVQKRRHEKSLPTADEVYDILSKPELTPEDQARALELLPTLEELRQDSTPVEDIEEAVDTWQTGRPWHDALPEKPKP